MSSPTVYVKLETPRRKFLQSLFRETRDIRFPILVAYGLCALGLFAAWGTMKMGNPFWFIFGLIMLSIASVGMFVGTIAFIPQQKGLVKTISADIFEQARGSYELAEVCKTFINAIQGTKNAWDAVEELCEEMCTVDPNRPDLRDAMTVIREAHWANVTVLKEAEPLLLRWDRLDDTNKRRISYTADKAQIRAEECQKLINTCTNRAALTSVISDPELFDEVTEEAIEVAAHWENLLADAYKNRPLELTVGNEKHFKQMRHRAADNRGLEEEWGTAEGLQKEEETE